MSQLTKNLSVFIFNSNFFTKISEMWIVRDRGKTFLDPGYGSRGVIKVLDPKHGFEIVIF